MENSVARKIADLEARVRAAQNGDEAALTSLIEETQTRLFRFLFLRGADSALASDLCQDTYLYAFEHLAELREPGAFMRWLFQIARHKFLDHRRSPRNQAYDDAAALGTLFPQDAELTTRIRQAMGRLEEPDREVVLLIDLEGYSYGEAAEIIGVSEAAVTSRLRRARASFNKYFNAPDRKPQAATPLVQRGSK